MHNIYIYILVMAGVTYLIRMLPLVLLKKEIKNQFVKSFLYYVPYACLAAMTFPAIITVPSAVATYGGVIGLLPGLVGFILALLLAYKKKSLIVVALAACAAVFLVERILSFVILGTLI